MEPGPKELRELLAAIKRGAVPALSIKQPYVQNILHDGKDVENRDWRTSYRGWIMLHASKATDELAASQLDLPRGGILGLVRLTDCVDVMDSPWFFGKFGFTLADPFPIGLIECRGMPGMFYPPAEIYAGVAGEVQAMMTFKALDAAGVINAERIRLLSQETIDRLGRAIAAMEANKVAALRKLTPEQFAHHFGFYDQEEKD